MKDVIVIAFTCTCFSGCSVLDSGGDDLNVKPRFHTDRMAYTAMYYSHNDSPSPLGVVLTVDVSYTNKTRRSVYMSKCGRQPPAPVLQKRDAPNNEEEWTNAVGKICTAVLVHPVEVKPGETYTQTVKLWGSLVPNVVPHFSVPFEKILGDYRLVYKVYKSITVSDGYLVSLDDLAPLEERISNTFQIIETRRTTEN